MKRFFVLPLILAASLPANALSLDCIMLDSFQGSTPPPANWAPLLTLHNCARRTVVPVATPRLNLLSWDSTMIGTCSSLASPFSAREMDASSSVRFSKRPRPCIS